MAEFGLSEEEAEAYLFLIREGSATATEVASGLDVNRMKAYRLMDSLSEKRYIQTMMERPKKFMPTPIEDITSHVLDKKKADLSTLAESQQELVHVIKEIKPREEQVNDPVFRIVQGRQQVYGEISQIIDNSKQRIDVYTSGDDFLRFPYAYIDDALKRASDRGVEILALTNINEGNIKVINEYLPFCTVRHLEELSRLRIIVGDGRELLFSFTMDPSMSMTTRNDTGLWTNSPAFTDAIKTFFDDRWMNSMDSAEVIEAVQEGTVPKYIRLIRSPEAVSQRIGMLIEEAQSTIDVLAEDLGPVIEHIDSIKTAARDGVEIRVASKLSYRPLSKLLEVVNQENIKNIDAGFSVLLVDDEKVLLRFKGKESSVESNNLLYVQSISSIFNEYWIKGDAITDIVNVILLENLADETMEAVKLELGDEWTLEHEAKYDVPGIGQLVFDYQLSTSKGQKMVMETASGDSLGEGISGLYAKAQLVPCDKAFLLVLKDPSEQERTLAEVYKVELIIGDTPEEAAKNFLKSISTVSYLSV